MVDAPVGIQKVGAVGSDAAPDWANATSAEAFEAAWLMIWEVIDMVFVSS
jgi:hypothetical protein